MLELTDVINHVKERLSAEGSIESLTRRNGSTSASGEQTMQVGIDLKARRTEMRFKDIHNHLVIINITSDIKEEYQLYCELEGKESIHYDYSNSLVDSVIVDGVPMKPQTIESSELNIYISKLLSSAIVQELRDTNTQIAEEVYFCLIDNADALIS